MAITDSSLHRLLTGRDALRLVWDTNPVHIGYHIRHYLSSCFWGNSVGDFPNHQGRFDVREDRLTASKPIEIADVLYKYLPPERIDILESMELRFSRPSEFNDTFDSQYLVPRSEGSKAIAA